MESAAANNPILVYETSIPETPIPSLNGKKFDLLFEYKKFSKNKNKSKNIKLFQRDSQ